jgi:hypothetical protein
MTPTAAHKTRFALDIAGVADNLNGSRSSWLAAQFATYPSWPTRSTRSTTR